MVSDSHRHGDKWIKHNLTVIEKDGAHQTEGGNPGLAVPARAIRGGLAGLLGLARFCIKFNSQTQQLAPEFRHRRIDCPVAKMIRPARSSSEVVMESREAGELRRGDRQSVSSCEWAEPSIRGGSISGSAEKLEIFSARKGCKPFLIIASIKNR